MEVFYFWWLFHLINDSTICKQPWSVTRQTNVYNALIICFPVGRPPGHPRGTHEHPGGMVQVWYFFFSRVEGDLFSFENDIAGPRGHTHGICPRQCDRQGEKCFTCAQMCKKCPKKLDTFLCYFCQWKVNIILRSGNKRLKKVVMLFLTTTKAPG